MYSINCHLNRNDWAELICDLGYFNATLLVNSLLNKIFTSHHKHYSIHLHGLVFFQKINSFSNIYLDYSYLFSKVISIL